MAALIDPRRKESFSNSLTDVADSQSAKSICSSDSSLDFAQTHVISNQNYISSPEPLMNTHYLVIAVAVVCFALLFLNVLVLWRSASLGILH